MPVLLLPKNADNRIFPMIHNRYYQHVLLFLYCVMLFMLASCGKEPLPMPTAPPHPPMAHFPLHNKTIHYNGTGLTVDLSGDGRADVLFDVTRIGDPIAKADKWWFTVLTNRSTYIAVNPYNETPVMEKEDIIPINNFFGFEWYVANEALLMERREFENGNITWNGRWLNADRKYIPLSVIRDNRRYNGWVEVSGSERNGTLTLHQAAVSQLPDVAVKAGIY